MGGAEIRVVIGMVPPKRSATMEVLAADEQSSDMFEFAAERSDAGASGPVERAPAAGVTVWGQKLVVTREVGADHVGQGGGVLRERGQVTETRQHGRR